MSGWLSKLLREWTAISAAPMSLAAAVVVPAAITWAAVNWSYSSVLADKNAQIERLNARASAYQDKLGGASPEQAAGEMQSLNDQLIETRRQLAEIQSPLREPNAVYQNGRRIGAVDGAEIDAASQSVAFQRMTVDRELDQATNLEFRDLVLSFRGYAAVTRAGRNPAVTYHNTRFAMVGHRQGSCATVRFMPIPPK
ncbi:MAG: hypothetical protein GEU91_00755 [Rhizobiales bacterium]|nr:hypothetical protein [Hyphomicrobiales bacterium]